MGDLETFRTRKSSHASHKPSYASRYKSTSYSKTNIIAHIV